MRKPPRDRALILVHLAKFLWPLILVFTFVEFPAGSFNLRDLFPFALFIFGFSFPSLWVLIEIARGARGNVLRGRRKMAWGIETLAVVCILWPARYLMTNEAGNSGHGQDEILGVILLAMMVPLAALAQLGLIPFARESSSDTRPVSSLPI